MLKNQKGITLVALMVTVVIMSILLTVTVNTSSSLVNNSKIRSLVTTMYLVQAKLDVLNEKYEFDPEADENKMQGDEVSVDELKKCGIEDISDEELVKWRKWNKEILNEFGINDDEFINDKNPCFYVHYGNDLEVVYPLGFSVNKQKFYKLSDLKEKDIE